MNYWPDLEEAKQIAWWMTRIFRAGQSLLRKIREGSTEQAVQNRLAKERSKLIWDGVVLGSFLVLGVLSLVYTVRES